MSRRRSILDNGFFVLCVIGLLAATVRMLGCAGPGQSASSVAAVAAAEALTAYEQARLSGADPEQALQSAGNAAITEAVASGAGLVDADYRPFVEAALRVLAAEMSRPKVDGPQYPSGASVADAIEHAIREAEASK